jgi:D-3-phosphoglycerate dehydrogenase / 2-oxoglutarate reductase
MSKIIFLDCNEHLLRLWRRVHRPDDPDITINMGRVAAQEIPATLAGYDTCINDATFFPQSVLNLCSGLRHIVFLGTGASSFIDLNTAASLGIKVSTIKGYGNTAVAEHTMALALAAARNVATMDREIRAGGWRALEGLQLFGKSFGILGYGGIGREVARIAKGIGFEAVAWNRSPVTDATIPLVPLDELLARSAILSLHLALNEQTCGFLDETKLRKTSPGVILVNTARAAIINPSALITLIREGHIRHAAIDVFDLEPPRSDDPLMNLENVTLTAHAGFLTSEATMTLLRRSIDLAAAV